MCVNIDGTRVLVSKQYTRGRVPVHVRMYTPMTAPSIWK